MTKKLWDKERVVNKTCLKWNFLSLQAVDCNLIVASWLFYPSLMDCKNISGTVMTIGIGITGEEAAVEAVRDMIVIDPTEVRESAIAVGVVVLVLTVVKIVGGEEMMMIDVVLATLIEGTQIHS